MQENFLKNLEGKGNKTVFHTSIVLSQLEMGYFLTQKPHSFTLPLRMREKSEKSGRNTLKCKHVVSLPRN